MIHISKSWFATLGLKGFIARLQRAYPNVRAEKFLFFTLTCVYISAGFNFFLIPSLAGASVLAHPKHFFNNRSASPAPIQREHVRHYTLMNTQFHPARVVGSVAVWQENQANGRLTGIESKNWFYRDGLPLESGWITRYTELSQKEMQQQKEAPWQTAQTNSGLSLSSIQGLSPLKAVGFPTADRFDYEFQWDHNALIKRYGQVHHQSGEIIFSGDKPSGGQSHAIQPEQSLFLESSSPFVFPESNAQAKLFEKHFHAPTGRTFGFQTLELGSQPKLVKTNVIPLALPTRIRLHQKLYRARAFRLENANASGQSAVIEWRSPKGLLLKAKALSDATEMVFSLQATARDASPLQSLDAIYDLRIPGGLIPMPRQTYSATYRLVPSNPENALLLTSFYHDARQKISESPKNQQASNQINLQGTNSIALNVTSKLPSYLGQPFPVQFPLQAALASSGLIQSNDPAILQTARQIVGAETRAYSAAQKLRRWVFEHIKNKNYATGFGSAKSALEMGSGDCTEHAVLLASLTRALGIPSRINVGLLYQADEEGKSGYWVFHTWTDIQLGIDETFGNKSEKIWVPLDATLPQPDVDATHIKLGDSLLNDANDFQAMLSLVGRYSGKFNIEVLSALSETGSVYDLSANKTQDLPGSINSQHLGNEVATEQKSVEMIDLKNLSPDQSQPMIDLNSDLTYGNTQAQVERFRMRALPDTLLESSREGIFQKGMALLLEGDATQASQIISPLLNEPALNAQTQLIIAKRLFGVGLYRLADRAFLEIPEKNPALQNEVSQWRSAMPWAPKLSMQDEQHYHQALSKGALGHVESASVLLKQQLVKTPWLAPAYSYLAQWDNNPAYYDQYRQVAPEDPRADADAGEWYLLKNQYGQAQHDFQLALKKAVKMPAVWKISSQDWRAKNEIARSLATLTTSPRDTQALLTLAQAYQFLGQANEAKLAVGKAFLYQPYLPDAVAARMQWAMAENDWIRASQLVPRLYGKQTTEALGTLGYYQMRERRYGLACPLLAKALLQISQNAALAEKLGQYKIWSTECHARQASLKPSSNKETFNTVAKIWTLLPDERDFLRQWVQADFQLLNRQSNLLKGLSATIENFTGIGLKAEANRQVMSQRFLAEAKWLQYQYSLLKNKPLPARFTVLHSDKLNYWQAYSALLQTAAIDLPSLTSLSSSQKRLALLGRLAQSVAMLKQAQANTELVTAGLPVSKEDWSLVLQAGGLSTAGDSDYLGAMTDYQKNVLGDWDAFLAQAQVQLKPLEPKSKSPESNIPSDRFPGGLLPSSGIAAPALPIQR